MRTLEEVREVLGAGRIAVVGNSALLLERRDGGAIDACDRVVRMNHGIPRPFQARSVGHRTDVWVCSYNNTAMQPRALRRLRPAMALHLTADKRHIHPDLLARAYVDPSCNAQALAERLSVSRPTTGLMTVNFLLETLKLSGPLQIFGFDCLQRANFYAPRRPARTHGHDPVAEQAYLAGLQQAGRIEIHGFELNEVRQRSRFENRQDTPSRAVQARVTKLQ